MTEIPERPFFIVGHPRSGTTLLRFLVSSHPRIYIPEETGFVPFLLPKEQTRQTLTLRELRSLLTRIAELNYLWRNMVDDVEMFYRSLPEPRLPYVLDALYRQKIRSHGAARWGDKTPVYVQYVGILNLIFPTAQFIHVIRDGRDAALSALKKWPDRRWYMDTFYLIKNWDRNVTAGRVAGRRLGKDRYEEVRYEALVNRPREVLERVTGFLGETFDPKMLDHTSLARRIGPGPHGHTEVQQPISTDSIGRWRTEMTDFDRKLTERIAGSTLEACGYEPGPSEPMTWAEQVRFMLLALKFRMFDATRTTLYAAGILTLNRDLRR
jgi:hypothetical protein